MNTEKKKNRYDWVKNGDQLRIIQENDSLRIVQEIKIRPRSSLTKDSKMVLDSALLKTQHYKVRIKGKVEKSREWSSTLPYTLV